MNNFLEESSVNSTKVQNIFKVLVSVCFENVSSESFFERILEESVPAVSESQRGVFLHYNDGNCYLVSYFGFGHKSIYKSRSIMNCCDFLPKELSGVNFRNIIDKKTADANWKNFITQVEQDSNSIFVNPFFEEDELKGVLVISCSDENFFSGESKAMLKELSVTLDTIYMIYKNLNREKAFKKTLVDLLIQLNEMHEPYLLGHCKRVSKYCREFGNYLGLEEKDIENLCFSALIHESGKLLIEEKTLNKRIRLNDVEVKKIRMYPMIGNNLMNRKPMDRVLQIVRSHHERWDGTGYPDNLAGEEIPYLSRILTVVDAFDSMTHDRPYKSKKTFEETKEEITINSGTQFDPEIAAFFVEMMETTPDLFIK